MPMVIDPRQKCHKIGKQFVQTNVCIIRVYATVIHRDEHRKGPLSPRRSVHKLSTYLSSSCLTTFSPAELAVSPLPRFVAMTLIQRQLLAFAEATLVKPALAGARTTRMPPVSHCLPLSAPVIVFSLSCLTTFSPAELAVSPLPRFVATTLIQRQLVAIAEATLAEPALAGARTTRMPSVSHCLPLSAPVIVW